jgi:hypothetical protein
MLQCIVARVNFLWINRQHSAGHLMFWVVQQSHVWKVALISRTYRMFGECGKLESLESARNWCCGAILPQRTFRNRSHATTMTQFVKAHLTLPLSHSIWTGNGKIKHLPPFFRPKPSAKQGCFGWLVSKSPGRQIGGLIGQFGIWIWILVGIVPNGCLGSQPKGWTLPVAGALVGCVTNWIVSIKLLFEPADPVDVLRFLKFKERLVWKSTNWEVSNQFGASWSDKHWTILPS